MASSVVRPPGPTNVEAVVDAVEEWLKEARANGQLEEHRARGLQREALDHLGRAARYQVIRALRDDAVQHLIERLRRREIDPASAARQALETMDTGRGARSGALVDTRLRT